MTVPGEMAPILLQSEAGPGSELRHVVRAALRTGLASGALVPRMHPPTVVPTLVSRPEAVGDDAWFGPALMLQNAASLLSGLTFHRPRGKVIAVLRSCEYRALVEISKLKQVELDAVLVIGVDCLGAAGPGPHPEKNNPAAKTITANNQILFFIAVTSVHFCFCLHFYFLLLTFYLPSYHTASCSSVNP